MRRFWIALLVVAACCRTERAIFVLGAQRYYMPEFEQYLKVRLGSEEPLKSSSEVLSRLLDKYIDEKIYAVSIQEKRIELRPGDLEAVLARLQQKDQQYAPGQPWLEKLKQDLLIDKFINLYLARGVSVGDQEVADYYRSHLEQYSLPEGFHAREILVHDQAEAEKVRRELVGKGTEAFAERARQQSKGLSASLGGDMGTRRPGQLPPEIEDAIIGLKPGEISPVVQTKFGFHVFMLEARLPQSTLSLEAARGDITRDLLETKIKARVQEWLKERRSELHLRIIQKNLGFDYQEEKTQ
ncbi:MAG: peptidyl-prolyl cis-trans isomerase [Acidobacteriota bacterium]